MILSGLGAADIGVQRLEPVDQPGGQQERERAIDRRRRGGTAFVAQLVEQLIGADRAVVLPHELEDPPAQGGQPQPPARAHRFGCGQGIVDAKGMVVSAGFEGRPCPIVHRVHR